MRWVLPVAALLAAGACSRTQGLVPPEPPPPELASIGPLEIDDLTRDERALLCREDFRRTDHCMNAGVWQMTREGCERVVAECRSEGEFGENPHCDDAPPGGAKTCPVRVDSYLACVDAWNADFTCERAGRWIDPPPECAEIVARCPRLAFAFERRVGTPPPCDARATRPVRTVDDVHGLDGCRPSPSRFVVLGDGIADCTLMDDKSLCAGNIVSEYVRRFAPDVSFEEHAAPRAMFRNLPEQASRVEPGPGHLFVWIYAIGRDIALRAFDDNGWKITWSETVAYFTDAERFPDGVTFLLNTQFSPYDQCSEPIDGSYTISPEEEEHIQRVNRTVLLDAADARSDTVAVDQYPDFLGHATKADMRGCPHCGADNTPWLLDLEHPNAAGNAHLASKWEPVIERMLGGGCAVD